MVSQIYPSKLQLNNSNISDTKASDLPLHVFISNDKVSCKYYNKRYDFDFKLSILISRFQCS